MVFHAERELVLVFEGDGAAQVARRLLFESRALDDERLRRYITGPPRILEEVFSWQWPQLPPGISFEPLPGPGDSEGASAAQLGSDARGCE